MLGEFVWISTGSYRQYKVMSEKLQDEEGRLNKTREGLKLSDLLVQKFEQRS